MSTKISATIIADSKNEFGQRLITYVLVFPRIILAELNTHRMFSRNSASSRAIPFKKMLERVQTDPFIPIAWQKDHSGMQGTEYFTDEEAIKDLTYNWVKAANDAASYAQHISSLGLTKQLCNRLLEPFLWHTAIVTATEYENFVALRCPQYHYQRGSYSHETFRSRKDVLSKCRENFSETMSDDDCLKTLCMPELGNELAWLKNNQGQGEIHIMALAEAMWDARNESTPKELKAGEWHIPFGDQIDESRIQLLHYGQLESTTNVEALYEQSRIKIATARCARVSYMNFDGADDYEKDIALYDRLAASGHMSPFEHVAQTMKEEEYYAHLSTCCMNYELGTDYIELKANRYGHSTEFGWSGNFRGFIQMRKMLPNENRTS